MKIKRRSGPSSWWENSVRILPRSGRFPPAVGEACLPVVGFNLKGRLPVDLPAVLDADWGIECRAELHCAPWAHEELGALAGGGALRASPGYFSSDSDVLTLVTALRALSES